MFWIIFFIGAIILTILGTEKSPIKHYKFVRALLVLFVALAALLQSSNGSDIDNYRVRFDQGDSWESLAYSFVFNEGLDVIEVGYGLLSFVFHKLHLGFSSMLLLCYLLINGVFIHLIYRFRFPLLGIVAFLVSISFIQEINIQRQMIAIALFYLGIEQIEKGSLVKYVICNLAAVLFHASSLFLLPFGALLLLNPQRHFYITKVTCGIAWGLSILIAIGFLNIGGVFGVLIRLMGDTGYEEYLSYEYTGMGSEVSLLYQFLMFFILISKEKKNLVYVILFFIGAIFANIASAMPALARFGFYFTAFLPLYVAQLVDENINNNYKFISIAYCAYYFGYRILITVLNRVDMLPDYSVLHNFV